MITTKDFLTRQINGAPNNERWHFLPWRLETVTTERLVEAVQLMFHDKKYERLREERTALYNKVIVLQADPKVTPSRIRGALRAIIEKDKEIACVLLENFARYAHDNGSQELLAMNDIANELGENPTLKQEDALAKLAVVHRRFGFKVESLENDILEMSDLMHVLIPDLRFMGAEGVRLALQQLRSFIDDTNVQLETQEEKNLYADTADSIAAYIDMRTNTFTKRLAELKNKRNRKQKRESEKKEKSTTPRGC